MEKLSAMTSLKWNVLPPPTDHPELYAQVPAQATHSESRWKQRLWIQEHCLLYSCLSWDGLHLCDLLSKPQGTATINNVQYTTDIKIKVMQNSLFYKYNLI